MNSFTFLQAVIAQPSSELWEIIKGVMLSLSTLGVGYLVRGVRALEVAVRDLQVDTRGVDGSNGIIGTQKAHTAEIRAIQSRNHRMDILAAQCEQERLSYTGTERRHHLRRTGTDRREEGEGEEDL